MRTKSLIILCCLCSITITAQDRYFVNQTNGNDGNNGKTWSKAFVTIQMALNNAKSGDEIWVAAGTYLPTKKIIDTDNNGLPTSDRYKTFVIPNGVKIYGGFSANSLDNTGMDKRDWEINKTILSGDLNKDDGENFTQIEDNVYHIVYLYNTDESTVIDGFTITGGNFDTPVPIRMVQGSGICAISNGSVASSPVLTNLIIEGNISTGGGAGFSNYSDGDASPVISNTIFRNNKSGEYGGGFANDAREISSPVLENVIFSGNQAFNGAGMYCLSQDVETSPVLTNVLIHGNLSTNRAGGICLYSFAGNVKPVFTNVTIAGNKSEGDIGGIYCLAYSAISSPEIRNTIIWGNTANEMSYYYDFYNEGNEGSNADIQSSMIGDREVFIGTIDPHLYPGFVRSVHASLAPTTEGDYRPDKDSPLINAGNNAFVTTTTDLAGKPRIFDKTVDIGAYEYQEISTVGITETNIENRIWSDAGNLFVRIDRPSTVRIYSVEGILIQQIPMSEGIKAISIPQGFYFVSLDNEAATKIYISK